MRPDSHTTHCYQQIDEVVRSVEKWLALSMRAGCGYEKTAICRRVAQAVVMKIVDPYLKNSVANYLSGKASFTEGLPARLYCGGLIINTATGKAKPTAGLFLSSVAKFMGLWLFALWIFLRPSMGRRKDSEPAALVHGVPDADVRAKGGTQRFENFCKNGPLDVLRKANKCIVHVAWPAKAVDHHRFLYSRFPLMSLFLANRLSIKEGGGFLVLHLKVLISYLLFILKHPIACLLWRDLSVQAVAATMNKNKLIEAIVITNTNWLQQYLWMSDLPRKNFLTHMVLYSLNSSALKFKDAPTAANHPGIRHLRADLILIWGECYKEILRSEGVNCATRVVGPILWYLPESASKQRNEKVRRICVFDVSPFNIMALQKRGILGNYYSAETMKSYLGDILLAVDAVKKKLGCEVEIVLKHKRTPTPAHDKAYFDYVDELRDSQKGILLEEEDANLFTLIAESDVIVVIPYSSPAYVANHLGIPALFYDPTNTILASVETGCPIPLVTKQECLTQTLFEILVAEPKKIDHLAARKNSITVSGLHQRGSFHDYQAP